MPADSPSLAIIIANGQVSDGMLVQAVLESAPKALVIAADGGAHHAEQLGLAIDLLIGDLDSISGELLNRLEQQGVEVIRFPQDKDYTDLELAILEAVKRGANQIRILGGFGGRFDQTLANVYLLARPELAEVDVRLVDAKESVWLLRPGSHEITGNAGDTISLLPVGGDVTGIVTKQLKYPLNGGKLSFGPARGVSNVMLNTKATVSFESGVLLVVYTLGRA